MATNHVTEAVLSRCWIRRSRRLVLEVPAKKVRSNASLPHAAEGSVDGETGEQSTAVQASATYSVAAVAPPGSRTGTTRQFFGDIRYKLRDAFENAKTATAEDALQAPYLHTPFVRRFFAYLRRHLLPRRPSYKSSAIVLAALTAVSTIIALRIIREKYATPVNGTYFLILSDSMCITNRHERSRLQPRSPQQRIWRRSKDLMVSQLFIINLYAVNTTLTKLTIPSVSVVHSPILHANAAILVPHAGN